MKEEISNIREDLLHVRRIHFLALLTSVTLIYLVLSEWSSAPGLISDLQHLREVINDFRDRNIEPSELVRLQWPWANQEADKILDGLQLATKIDHLSWILADSEGAAEILNLRERGLELLARRSRSKDSARHAFRIGRIERSEVFDNQNARLNEIISALKSARITIEAVKNFVPSQDAMALGTWANQHLSNGATRIEVTDFEIESWPSSNLPGEAVVNVKAVHEEKAPGRRGALEIKRITSTHKARVSFESEQREIRIHMESFWDNFPILKNFFLKETDLLSLDEAIAWAQRQRTAGLQSSDTAIAGLKIKGAHVGVVGPPAVLLLLMYMLCYITHISKRAITLSNNQRAALATSSPWLGSMANVWARVLGPLTLVLAPFLGVTLPLWRFTEANLFLSSAIGLLAAAAGGYCLMAGAKIARGEP